MRVVHLLRTGRQCIEQTLRAKPAVEVRRIPDRSTNAIERLNAYLYELISVSRANVYAFHVEFTSFGMTTLRRQLLRLRLGLLPASVSEEGKTLQ
jgi:hypothetical protein